MKATLTIQDVRDVILSSNKNYQAIFISMFQSGMDLSTFEYWNRNGWDSLKEQLRRDSGTVRIDLPGRKRRRNKQGYYTLIGYDAINAIKSYLPHRIDEAKFTELEEKRKEWCRKHNKEWSPKEYVPGWIFYNQQGNPIKKGRVQVYWLKHLTKIGKVTPVQNGNQSTRLHPD